jgi:phosphocarrier protein
VIRRRVTISNKLGLHARAAAKFVQTASGFGAEIELVRDHQRVNGKSIMGVMMLAASQGSSLDMVVDGDDEAQAAAALENLINDKFGEGA